MLVTDANTHGVLASLLARPPPMLEVASQCGTGLLTMQVPDTYTIDTGGK